MAQKEFDGDTYEITDYFKDDGEALEHSFADEDDYAPFYHNILASKMNIGNYKELAAFVKQNKDEKKLAQKLIDKGAKKANAEAFAKWCIRYLK